MGHVVEGITQDGAWWGHSFNSRLLWLGICPHKNIGFLGGVNVAAMLTCLQQGTQVDLSRI